MLLKDKLKTQKLSYLTGQYVIARALQRDAFGSFAFSFCYFDDREQEIKAVIHPFKIRVRAYEYLFQYMTHFNVSK